MKIDAHRAIKDMAHNIPNLGPVSCQMLYEAGIQSADDFFEFTDPEAVFWALFKVHGTMAVNANLMYSIDGALCGETWASLPHEKKDHWKQFLSQVRASI